MKRNLTKGALALWAMSAICYVSGCVSPTVAVSKKLIFPTYGFSIEPLEQSSDEAHQVLSMSLPPINGDMPSVNVTKQAWVDTLDQYISSIRNGSDLINGKVISESRLSEDTVIIERLSGAGNLKTHWYTKATLIEGTIWVADAIVAEDAWESLSGELKRCVDSLGPVKNKQPVHGDLK